MKLCMSTIPVRTESSWRLAGSEDKVERIHTLCHPEDPSIAQSSLWKRPQRKFGFSKVMPIWKKYHSRPYSWVRLWVCSQSHPASFPPGQGQSRCLSSWHLPSPLRPRQGMWAIGICRTRSPLVQPCYWWEEKSSMFFQHYRNEDHFRQELRHCLLLLSAICWVFISFSLAHLGQGQPKYSLQLLPSLIIDED